jgi:L-lactate permease
MLAMLPLLTLFVMLGVLKVTAWKAAPSVVARRA